MGHKITFDMAVGWDKPHSAAGDPCPFCARDKLVNILETRGDMIWLMNKYPVFHDTWPTVLVETAEHDADLSTYTREKAREVISFGTEKWLEMMRRPEFRSVLYFRGRLAAPSSFANHGSVSLRLHGGYDAGGFRRPSHLRNGGCGAHAIGCADVDHDGI